MMMENSRISIQRGGGESVLSKVQDEGVCGAAFAGVRSRPWAAAASDQ